MTDRIVVFNGSKRDFDNYLNNAIENNSGTIPFMELIQHYNARIRPSESGVKEADLHKKIQVENCIVRADDYSSVLPHVLSNFANIVALNYDIDTLYIQNPPRRVLESLETSFAGAINYEYSVYPSIGRKELREIYRNISLDVLGQESCKKTPIKWTVSINNWIDRKACSSYVIWPIWCWKNRKRKKHQ